jgi:hypothetical protein
VSKSEPDRARLPATASREQQINVRIDSELHQAATERAAPYGLAPVIRAFLRAFARGAVELPTEDLLREMASAPRGRPARHKPRKPPKD